MSNSPDEPRQSARFYTSARRVNILLGKFPNGGRIPGGPYTITQIALGSAALIVGWKLKPFWGPHVGTPLVQIVGLLAVCAGITWISGQIPATRRKLPNLALDTLHAATVSGTGTYKGKKIKLRQPRAYTGAVLMQLDAADGLAALEQQGAAARTTTMPEAPRVHPAVPAAPLPDNVIPLRPRTYTSGLERLIEQARKEQR